jgi:hypothetical protein
MEENDAENHGEIRSNIAANNPMFASWQILEQWKQNCEGYKLFIDFKKT